MRRRIPFVMVALGLYLAWLHPSHANGRRDPILRLRGTASCGSGLPSLSAEVEIDPIIFQISTVQGRYKLFRIRLVNGCGRVLHLDKTKDKVEAMADGKAVGAIIDMPQHDKRFWDSLSFELRQALAYPRGLEPNEEQAIFVFIATDGLSAAPNIVAYSISELSQPLQITNRGATTK